MKNITFVVDSGSDYEHSLSSYLDFPVRVVPLHINIEGKEYLDGVDISKDDFYHEMNKASELPKTSQPTPHFFHEVFKEELNKGNQVLFVSISSKLSGTYQSAVIAKEMLTEEEQKQIYLIDSYNISVTIFLLLIKANEMLLNGNSLDEVVKELETYKSKVNFIALLDTLENLKKGGRISTTQATIGGILNIKPLITVKDGLIDTIDKFRGRKKGIKYMSDQLNDLISQINKEKVFLVHSFLNIEKLNEEVQSIDLSKYKEIIYVKLGATLGTHGAANLLGFVFERNN